MALTRRTPAFGDLAQRTEQLLASQGVQVSGAGVDAVLNHLVDHVATRMGVTARAALGYAPTDLPEIAAGLIVEALALDDEPSTRSHLHLADDGRAREPSTQRDPLVHVCGAGPLG